MWPPLFIFLMNASSGGSPSVKLFSPPLHPPNKCTHTPTKQGPFLCFLTVTSYITTCLSTCFRKIFQTVEVSSLYPRGMTHSRYLMAGGSSAMETLSVFRGAAWIRLALLSIWQHIKVSIRHNYFFLDTTKLCLTHNPKVNSTVKSHTDIESLKCKKQNCRTECIMWFHLIKKNVSCVCVRVDLYVIGVWYIHWRYRGHITNVIRSYYWGIA